MEFILQCWRRRDGLWGRWSETVPFDLKPGDFIDGLELLATEPELLFSCFPQGRGEGTAELVGNPGLGLQ